MYFHNFKYSLILLLKNKGLVFWTIAFPLIMAFLFNMAFSNIDNTESFKAIDIAVVNDKEYDDNIIFKNALQSLSEGEEKTFNIKYTDEKSAKELLDQGDVTAVVQFKGDDVKVSVESNGINETIVQYIIDEIKSDSEVIINIGADGIKQQILSGNSNIDYEKYFSKLAEDIMSEDVKVKDMTPENMSYVMIEYYSLIAMTCLYSAMFSMTLINYCSANISAVGKRTTVSPAKKGAVILGSLSAAFAVQIFAIILLYIVMIFFIGVDFGNDFWKIVMLSLAGSLAGVAFGTAFSVYVKLNDNAKLTALISVIMACCFFSGMMGIVMKNIIDKNVPVLNMINPAAMITDGFYALYYYNAGERFYFDLVSLLLFSAVMIIISVLGLRRQRYDSI